MGHDRIEDDNRGGEETNKNLVYDDLEPARHANAGGESQQPAH